MTTTNSNLIPIQIMPGVQPSSDKTAFATPHYTMSDKIRFRFGFPQKIGGWYSILFNNGDEITGVARSIFSAILSTAINTLIGTNTRLYSLIGSNLINITPLQTATVALATDPLSTDYGTLAANTLATVAGSSVITITDNHSFAYKVGDPVTLSGATGFNGITTGQINSAHAIQSIGFGNYTIVTAGLATATGSGGGASVLRRTGLITVSAVAHGMTEGDRVKIAGAATIGGVTGTEINMEFVIRDVFPDLFFVMTQGVATSSVSSGGGASVTIQPQIPMGAENESFGQGYGMGLYGVGLYGTALISNSGLSYPRIWFMDRFGTDIIMTPGNQGGLYGWDGADIIAPALVANAPTAINYAFVSNNIVVTFGAGGVVNRIFACDQGNMTQWTSSSSNQVFDDTVVGAGAFKSHVPVSGANLIFTDRQTYLFAYTGYTAGIANGIWDIQQLENNIGIIAPMARCSVMGVAYWMGQNNFHMWTGGNVSIIPANDQEQSTILNYVFLSINRAQSAKCFAWYNEQFDEIWFHYPSAFSNECDSVARLNRTDLTWVPDTFDRTAAEYPNLTLGYPRLTSSDSVFYAHEQGNDADGVSMPWMLATNLRGGDFARNAAGAASRKTYMLTGFVPDSLQSGDISVEIIGKLYPQSSKNAFDEGYTVSPDTDFITTQAGARLWQYILRGDESGQNWTGGQWHEFVKESSPQ